MPPRCCGWRAMRWMGFPSSPRSSGRTFRPSSTRHSPWSGAPARWWSRCRRLGHFGVVLIAADDGLSTAEVYAEADRLGLGRDPDELDSIAAELREAAGRGASPLEYRELLVNDLAHAALSLRPAIGGALAALEEAGPRSRW